jgi:hypothetical protein
MMRVIVVACTAIQIRSTVPEISISLLLGQTIRTESSSAERRPDQVAVRDVNDEGENRTKLHGAALPMHSTGRSGEIDDHQIGQELVHSDRSTLAILPHKVR